MRSAWMELRRTAADALHTFILAPQRSGVGLLTDLLRMGPRGWAWLLLLFATLGTAFVFTLPGVGPQVRYAQEELAGLLRSWIRPLEYEGLPALQGQDMSKRGI